MKYQEGDIEFDFSSAETMRKFDGPSHQLVHAMKAVDFVVNTSNTTYLVEVKDPQHPKAQKEQSESFIDNMKTGKIMEMLRYKYRDSYLYLSGMGQVTTKVIYLVLICFDKLTAAELVYQTQALKRHLPLLGPGKKPWENPFVAGCAVYNLDMWNRHTIFPARRVSHKP